MEHAPQAFTSIQEIKRLVDLWEGKVVGDVMIQINLLHDT